jgi:hypothetical protein
MSAVLLLLAFLEVQRSDDADTFWGGITANWYIFAFILGAFGLFHLFRSFAKWHDDEYGSPDDK